MTQALPTFSHESGCIYFGPTWIHDDQIGAFKALLRNDRQAALEAGQDDAANRALSLTVSLRKALLNQADWKRRAGQPVTGSRPSREFPPQYAPRPSITDPLCEA